MRTAIRVARAYGWRGVLRRGAAAQGESGWRQNASVFGSCRSYFDAIRFSPRSAASRPSPDASAVWIR